MKSFFKYVLATITGVLIACFFVGLISFLIIVGIASAIQDSETVSVEPNTVIKFDLNYSIPERTQRNSLRQIDLLSFETKPMTGLNDLLKNLKKASADKNIKGIYLNLGMATNGWATLEELRNAIIEFKASGKFVVAYGEIYTQKVYYLASVADKIYLNPTGMLDFSGLSAEIMFFQHTLEKLDIEPQIFYAGKFKSATEPFRLDKMSEENKEQTVSFLGDIFHHFKHGIADARKMDEAMLDSIADHLMVRHPEDAKDLGLVDDLYYKDQVWGHLKETLGLEEEEEIKFLSMHRYTRAPDPARVSARDRIAVIYGQGNIVSGEGDDDEIGATTFAESIRKARKDARVKAIVLRINSPGGSALASDIIWREVELAKAEKPVVASMGNYAASGGYYISCPADTIVTQPNTLTGSIGVFFILPNFQQFFSNKLGITFDGVKTSKYADMPSVTRPVTPEEEEIYQMQVDRIYQDFLDRVVAGRGSDEAYIRSIAQGRVWTGTQAIEKGLADLSGGLDQAISTAAAMANVSEYRVREYPELKDPLVKLLEDLQEQASLWFRPEALESLDPYFRQLEQLIHLDGPQARLPFELIIH